MGSSAHNTKVLSPTTKGCWGRISLAMKGQIEDVTFLSLRFKAAGQLVVGRVAGCEPVGSANQQSPQLAVKFARQAYVAKRHKRLGPP
jgi:hypothetical protein